MALSVNESPMYDFFAAEIIKDVKVFRAKKSTILTFRVTTQVAPDSESTCGTAVCVVSFNTNLSNLTNRAG